MLALTFWLRKFSASVSLSSRGGLIVLIYILMYTLCEFNLMNALESKTGA